MALRSGHLKPIDSKKGTTPVRGPEYTTCPARRGVGWGRVCLRACPQDRFKKQSVWCVWEKDRDRGRGRQGAEGM